MAKPGEGPSSLEDQAINTLLKAFEQASQEAKNTYTCGGSINLQQPIKVLLQSGERPAWQGTPLSFPGALAIAEALCHSESLVCL